MSDSGPEPLKAVPEKYARATGARAAFLLEGVRGLFAAKWRLPSFRITSPWAPHHALGYRVSGIATITRSCGGVEVRKVPPIGSVTFSPGDRPTGWASDAPLETIHVYIAAEALQRFAEQHLDRDRPPAIRDFFGITDPWLSGYFKLLDSECAQYDELSKDDPRRPADSLFLDQTEHLLLHHLVRSHSDAGRATAHSLGERVRVAPLGRVLTRRIEEYIDANMAADMSLSSLSLLARVSPDHFLRAFRAATGKTPHRFVLDRRLERAAALLRAEGAAIAEVARACGFRSAAHFSVKFHARFGVTPSQYRRSP
jgi:AraC family transcriptional regulator